EHADDLPLHLYGMGNVDMATQKGGGNLGDRGLAVTGRPEEEDRAARVDRRPYLIEGLLVEHEVAKRRAQCLARHDDVADSLPLHGERGILQSVGARSRV